MSGLSTRSGTWSGKTGPVARSASRRTSSRELTSSSRVGTLPTSWTTEQAGSRGSCSTIACSVRPHEIPRTSRGLEGVGEDRGGGPAQLGGAELVGAGDGAHDHGAADPVPAGDLVREGEVQLRERVDLDPDDAVAARPLQQPRDLEARDAELGRDLALAGAVEVVAPAGEHRVDEVQARCRGVHLRDHGADPTPQSNERQVLKRAQPKPAAASRGPLAGSWLVRAMHVIPWSRRRPCAARRTTDAWGPDIASKAAVRLRGAHAHDDAARDPCAPRKGSDDGLGHGGAALARGERGGLQSCPKSRILASNRKHP